MNVKSDFGLKNLKQGELFQQWMKLSPKDFARMKHCLDSTDHPSTLKFTKVPMEPMEGVSPDMLRVANFLYDLYGRLSHYAHNIKVTPEELDSLFEITKDGFFPADTCVGLQTAMIVDEKYAFPTQPSPKEAGYGQLMDAQCMCPSIL